MIDRNRDFILETFPKNSIGCEIGVHLGEFSERIIEIVRPKKLYLVDPWTYQPEYKQTIYGNKRISQKDMNDRYEHVVNKFKGYDNVKIRRMESEVFLKQFCKSLDWVYIDGLHSYDGCMSDLKLSWPKIKKGGYLTGDDYGLSQFFGFTRGVSEAVKDFSNEYGIPFEVKKHQFIFRKGLEDALRF